MTCKFLDKISESELKDAYDFKINNITLEIIINDGIQCIVTFIKDFEGSNRFPSGVEYSVVLIDTKGNQILDNINIYIKRYLFPDKELWSLLCKNNQRIFGRVAYNSAFFLSPKYCKKGIGKTIYGLEENLYKKWGAREIHMTAARDGKAVWRKFGFILFCDDVGNVEKMYKEWCRDNNIEYSELKDINRYPEKFLLSDWVSNFRMYKEINNV